MCEPRDKGTAKQEPKLARGAVSEQSESIQNRWL